MATLRETAAAASGIIFGNEGGYGSVNRNDCGALSVGKLQWHGTRALALLRSIVRVIPDQAEKYLGRLTEEIAGDADWSGRTASEEEAGRISSLLLTDAGKRIQDETALADIEADIYRGVGYGLCNCGALIYFADGANQYGRYSALWKNAAQAAVLTGGGLDDLHRELCARTTGHLERRQRVYEKVKGLALAREMLEDGSDSEAESQTSGSSSNTEKTGKENDGMTHLVVKGDTLSALAKRYGVSIDTLISANVGKYPTMTRNYIVCGWKLSVPTEQLTERETKSEADTAAAALKARGILRGGEQLTDEQTLLLVLGRMCLLMEKS